jgi:hypothetical protein
MFCLLTVKTHLDEVNNRFAVGLERLFGSTSGLFLIDEIFALNFFGHSVFLSIYPEPTVLDVLHVPDLGTVIFREDVPNTQSFFVHAFFVFKCLLQVKQLFNYSIL